MKKNLCLFIIILIFSSCNDKEMKYQLIDRLIKEPRTTLVSLLKDNALTTNTFKRSFIHDVKEEDYNWFYADYLARDSTMDSADVKKIIKSYLDIDLKDEFYKWVDDYFQEGYTIIEDFEYRYFKNTESGSRIYFDCNSIAIQSKKNNYVIDFDFMKIDGRWQLHGISKTSQYRMKKDMK